MSTSSSLASSSSPSLSSVSFKELEEQKEFKDDKEKRPETPRYQYFFSDPNASYSDKIIQASSLSSSSSSSSSSKMDRTADKLNSLGFPTTNIKKITDPVDTQKYNKAIEAEARFAFRSGNFVILSPFSIILIFLSEIKEIINVDQKKALKKESIKKTVTTIIERKKIQKAFLIRLTELHQFIDNYTDTEKCCTDFILTIKSDLHTILKSPNQTLSSFFQLLNRPITLPFLSKVLCNSEKDFQKIQTLLLNMEKKPSKIKELIQYASNDLHSLRTSTSSSRCYNPFKGRLEVPIVLTREKILRSIIPNKTVLFDSLKINGTQVNLSILPDLSKEDILHTLLEPILADVNDRTIGIDYLLNGKGEPHWISSPLTFTTIEYWNIACLSGC